MISFIKKSGSSFRKYLSPSRLTGPIFEKELRVSSRRRRNYLLRFAYIALLTLFVIIAWLTIGGGIKVSGGITTSRSSLIGQIITTVIVGFQFVALQLIAVITNLGLTLSLWIAIPLLTSFVAESSRIDKPMVYCFTANPIVQTGIVMHATGGARNARKEITALQYDWPFHQEGSSARRNSSSQNPIGNFTFSSLIILLTTFFYLSLGFGFAWRAQHRLRRNIFS